MCHFRYQRSSRDSKMLAEEVAKTIAREESLFENAKTDAHYFIYIPNRGILHYLPSYQYFGSMKLWVSTTIALI
uniref:Uncharacterized protein n=1 Tax=Wuchereria bancrofti TaxID=6293 RepID=A0A1I8ETH0_WUCBA